MRASSHTRARIGHLKVCVLIPVLPAGPDHARQCGHFQARFRPHSVHSRQVSACASVPLCLCACVSMPLCICACVSVSLCLCICASVSVCLRLCVFMSVHLCLGASVSLCLYAHLSTAQVRDPWSVPFDIYIRIHLYNLLLPPLSPCMALSHIPHLRQAWEQCQSLMAA